MYSNAARDDLWSKLSQVTLTWTAGVGSGREEGAGLRRLWPPQSVHTASETLTFHVVDDLTRRL